MRRHDQPCERAREWISLAPDGELSRFEQALADAHLKACAECAEFARDVRGFTYTIRSTPLEALPHPVVVAPRRTPVFRSLHVAAAALAVAAVGVGSLASSLGQHSDRANRFPRAAALDVATHIEALKQRQKAANEEHVLEQQAEVSQDIEGGPQLLV